MAFGLTGSRRAANGLPLLALPLLLLASGGEILAQEPGPGGCTLPLPVPDGAAIAIVQQPTQRGLGLKITWPDLDPSASTCRALVDTGGLGVTVTLSGTYLDRYDRRLQFQFPATGAIGDTTRNRVLCRWNNLGPLTGTIGGEINCSNTSGLWLGDNSGWRQHNTGLPINLAYTNLLDLSISADGTLLCALSAGDPNNLESNPRGVFLAPAGGAWTEIAPATFGRSRALARVAMHPEQSGRFAVGTTAHGVFITSDGGQTFQQWTSNLDASFSPMPVNFQVTALLWRPNRLYVALRDFGLFVSSDNGASFTRLANLTIPGEGGAPLIPRVRSLAADLAGDRLVAGLTSLVYPASNGIYESRDAGQTWQSLNDNFQGLPDGGVADPGAAKTVLSLHADGQDLVMGTERSGIWASDDGGATWYEAEAPFANDDYPIRPSVWSLTRHEGQLIAQVQGHGLHRSSDGGRSWTALAVQPFNKLGRRVVSTPDGLALAAAGGGIYQPGSPFTISSTILSSLTPDPVWQNVEFGLSLAFGPGTVTVEPSNPSSSTFGLIAQKFQGWAIWRSLGGSPDDLVMIGRYDLNNPETCIEGDCWDDFYLVKPGCFGERLAACFDFSQPGQVSFYDENVFNGFLYYYAVTPYDYGDISLLASPANLTATMIFPARYPDDPLSAIGGGNRIGYQVNLAAQPALDGDEIYVYPNPLRAGSGIAGGEGELVVWTNLPPESRIQVFTLAGDRIAELPRPDRPQEGGNLYWITRNDDNRLLASGIYMWRVIMPQRGDFWGKLVIIR